MWPTFMPIVSKFMHILSTLFILYLFIGIFLYCCLTWVACAMLNMLEKDVLKYSQRKRRGIEGDYDLWHQKLVSWKHRYYLIDEFVHQINNSFGPFILLMLTSYFIRMTNNSFIFLNCFKKPFYSELWGAIYAFFIIKDLLYFSGIVYFPYLVKQEVLSPRFIRNLFSILIK